MHSVSVDRLLRPNAGAHDVLLMIRVTTRPVYHSINNLSLS